MTTEEGQRAIELDGNQRELKKQLDAFEAKFGAWETFQFLLHQLVSRQKKDNHITKADYAGDDFRVSIKINKRR